MTSEESSHAAQLACSATVCPTQVTEERKTSTNSSPASIVLSYPPENPEITSQNREAQNAGS
eukprot:1780646-Amphidinium_carterae.1